MCLQVPGKIVRIENNKATIDYDIEKRQASIADVKCSVGDYVLVVGGFVVDILPKKNAIEALNHWKRTMLG